MNILESWWISLRNAQVISCCDLQGPSVSSRAKAAHGYLHTFERRQKGHEWLHGGVVADLHTRGAFVWISG